MESIAAYAINEIVKREDACEAGNDYDGEKMGARILAVFVILATSAFGAFFPILLSRYLFIRLPPVCFFVAKYFGLGVIVATAFIHLLEPASDALGNECLGGTFAEYPWAFGICLMTLFVLFFVELCVFHYVEVKTGSHSHSHFGDTDKYVGTGSGEASGDNESQDKAKDAEVVNKTEDPVASTNPYPSHFSHAHEHQDPEVIGTPAQISDREAYIGSLVLVFVLEFGIIFHSVFIGLSLAVAGDEFVSLYCVLVFHQMFEGLGLGTRIASTPWPALKRWTPWMLALGYTLTTPIAIAIGLGVRHTYPPNSRRALITNGVFDSISAGILVYTGLVELMAHEFLYSDEFKGEGGFKRLLKAYVIMAFGAGIMALLGKWA